MNLFTAARRSIKLESSDFFNEARRRFIEEYDNGGNTEFSRTVLLDEFHGSSRDGEFFLHDVYFGLADAMWETGCLSDDLLRMVGDIITSGTDLDYFRTKAFPAGAVEERRKELNDFLCKLMLPNPKPRPRIPPEHRDLISLRVGDVFSYDDGGRRRLVAIADVVDCVPFVPVFYCCVLSEYFDDELPFEDDIYDAEIGMMGLFTPSKMLPADDLEYVTHLRIPEGRYVELFRGMWLFKERSEFYGELKMEPRCTLRGLIECEPFLAFQYFPLKDRFVPRIGKPADGTKI